MILIKVEGQPERVLEDDYITIGSGPECDIVFDDECVTRRHARLYKDNSGRWFVEDMGSASGTYLLPGPSQIYGAVPLWQGAKIRVGALHTPHVVTVVPL